MRPFYKYTIVIIDNNVPSDFTSGDNNPTTGFGLGDNNPTTGFGLEDNNVPSDFTSGDIIKKTHTSWQHMSTDLGRR